MPAVPPRAWPRRGPRLLAPHEGVRPSPLSPRLARRQSTPIHDVQPGETPRPVPGLGALASANQAPDWAFSASPHRILYPVLPFPPTLSSPKTLDGDGMKEVEGGMINDRYLRQPAEVELVRKVTEIYA